MKFRVYRSYRCPCERCAGELIQPADVAEALTFRQAVEQASDWNRVSIYDGLGDAHTETSSFPVSRGDWIQTTQTVFRRGCGGESVSLSVSVHAEKPLSAFTIKRIMRLI